LIDATVVSNERFAEFIRNTGYVTDAERFGWSFVFAGLLQDDFEHPRGARTRATARQGTWDFAAFGISIRHSVTMEERA
jgi:hypothetical protein